MICPICKKEMIYGGDHDSEDYWGEEAFGGIVSNASCHNDECDVDTVLIYNRAGTHLDLYDPEKGIEID